VVFGPDHDLYVSSGLESDNGNGNGHRDVLRYDGATGAFLGDFADANVLQSPRAVLFGPDGNLYVADGFANAIVRYDGRTGALLGDFVAPGYGGLSDPLGMVFGPDGKSDGKLDLYVTSVVGSFRADSGKTIFNAAPGTSEVLRYDGTTGALIGTFVGPDSGGLQFPAFMTFTETDPTTLNYVGTNPTPTPAAMITAPAGLAEGSWIVTSPGSAAQTFADLAPPSRWVPAPVVLAPGGQRSLPPHRPVGMTGLNAHSRVFDLTPARLGAHLGDRTAVNDLIRLATG
jgi:sugar lactone lactonase YvrE